MESSSNNDKQGRESERVDKVTWSNRKSFIVCLVGGWSELDWVGPIPTAIWMESEVGWVGPRSEYSREMCDTLGVCTVVVYLFYASCA